jgi:type 1 fimbriae regulatory protein FimE
MGTSDNVIALRQPSFYGKLRKPRNDEVRSREHLTPSEVASLVKAAKEMGRHGHRDATLILIAYRHGLRVSELVALRWDQVDLEQGVLHVHRLKGGTASTHPLRGPEIRALRRLRRDYPGYPVSVRVGTWRPRHGPYREEAR